MTSKASMKHQLQVGIFLFFGLAIFLISLFTVGGEGMLSSKVILHAVFDQVQGLAPGSLVSLSGVKVGNVKQIDFVPEENKLDVHMEIDEKFLYRITQGSKVEIRTQGALGDKFIFIIPGPASATALKEGDRLDRAEATDLMGVLSEKASEAGKIFDVISEIHKFTKALNEGDRGAKMIANFSEASSDMKLTAKEVRELVVELRKDKRLAGSVEKLDKILAKIDRGEGSLGALINDPSLHDSLKAMVGGQDRKKNFKSLIRSSLENQTPSE